MEDSNLPIEFPVHFSVSQNIHTLLQLFTGTRRKALYQEISKTLSNSTTDIVKKSIFLRAAFEFACGARGVY